MSANPRRPYKRPMQGWWRRNPYFVEYVIHEATACFVAAYALVLLSGVLCVMQGEGAWNAWLAVLRHPLSIAVHLVMLVAVGYHSWSWFKIMPKTLPPIRVRGERVGASAIFAGGLAATAIASLIVIVVAWGVLR
ncbi:hypothetical protein GCM10025771_29660 [Niveibacterium umoris]|uniref:Fumarate reductase subunit C n=1 Tax=Niveibacterium umoris TaxID=1193620 RepID=A0A840BE75_9RHOO|nr:fumarate reductase subunit C [Niveibacterium umoris]MBB4011841.1 fumarate reductase subunit C [Niveibacterium umoris]